MTTPQKFPHRSAEAVLRLRDAAGRPLAGAAVKVRQLRQRFLFGANIFLLKTADRSPAQLAYQERFTALLNFATLPFYWGGYEDQPDRYWSGYEKTPGNPEESRLLAIAAWCRVHGLVAKGHPLCWHEFAPVWHTQFPLEEMHRRQMGRVRREVERFRDLIGMWDVVNEAVATPKFKRPSPMGGIVGRQGLVPTIKEAFAIARQANPQATLLLNDYDHTDAYLQLIEQCLDAGVEIDAIGIQSHMHRGYLGDDVIRQVCDRFAKFAKPLHWTEATLISGEIRPQMNFQTRQESWPSTPEGEARQAEEVAHFYSTLYAHPAVAAITWWDLRDGCWLNAPSGLLRQDLSPKPAYERLMQLIKGDWWTPEQTLQTDAAGTLKFHGVLGDYELSAAKGKARFALAPDGLRDLALDLS